MYLFSYKNNFGQLIKDKLWQPEIIYITRKAVWRQSKFCQPEPAHSPACSSKFIIKHIMGMTRSLNNEAIYSPKQTHCLEKEIPQAMSYDNEMLSTPIMVNSIIQFINHSRLIKGLVLRRCLLARIDSTSIAFYRKKIPFPFSISWRSL